MHTLAPPDSHHLNAAFGWLGLGLRTEAQAELNLISPEQQQHPDVLELRWEIHATERRWDAALDVARTLIKRAPERVSGWLHQAYALRRVPDGGLEKAWSALKLAAGKFPQESLIAYNLSCYACQMRQLDEARVWLQRAIRLGGREHIKELALDDSDLKSLWPEIREL